MEKNFNSISYNHSITLNERKVINISGVIKIESFDDEEFLIETNMGFLVIKGSNLEILKLDTKDSIISIKGTIDSLSYFENLKKKNNTSIFEKLFK